MKIKSQCNVIGEAFLLSPLACKLHSGQH